MKSPGRQDFRAGAPGLPRDTVPQGAVGALRGKGDQGATARRWGFVEGETEGMRSSKDTMEVVPGNFRETDFSYSRVLTNGVSPLSVE